MDYLKLFTILFTVVCSISYVASWGNRNGGRRPWDDDDDDNRWRPWWPNNDPPKPADNGLTENCSSILVIASDELQIIASEMPAHYGLLIPELEVIFALDILNYPVSGDTAMYNAIGEFVLACDSLESVAGSPLIGNCKKQLMLVVKKLNNALATALGGLKEIETSLATRSVPSDVTDMIEEWTLTLREALAVRNDILECFIIADVTPEDEDDEDIGDGGDEGQLP